MMIKSKDEMRKVIDTRHVLQALTHEIATVESINADKQISFPFT